AIEPLESRTLMAAQEFNLLSLLHYNRPSSSWTYDVSDSINNDGKKSTGTTTATVAIGKKAAVVGGIKSDVVVLAIGKTKLTAAWFTTSKGTFIDLATESTTLGPISVQLTNTKVGPAEMVVGTPYSGKGTFSASFSGTFKGHAYTATISGNDSISAELIGAKTVGVPAGRFSTIQGNYTINISGKLSVKSGGETFPGTFTAVHEQTFYAAPTVGIVKFTQVDNAAISVPGIVSTATKLTASGNLVTDVLT
ncbi:MAG TPA: hypothetical protein VKK61_05580, partial [Tepidisphaeraceae bacterium]|nr:hypothetical protein [Tepidisphaeraceae bacterium]